MLRKADAKKEPEWWKSEMLKKEKLKKKENMHEKYLSQQKCFSWKKFFLRKRLFCQKDNFRQEKHPWPHGLAPPARAGPGWGVRDSQITKNVKIHRNYKYSAQNMKIRVVIIIFTFPLASLIRFAKNISFAKELFLPKDFLHFFLKFPFAKESFSCGERFSLQKHIFLQRKQ